MIENEKGQKANIGLGFTDRNDAFDFISSLDDYVRQLNRVKGVEKYDVSEPEKELFNKKAEKFELKISGITDKPKAKKSGGGLKKLGAPPGSKKVAALLNKKQDQPEEGKSNDVGDLLGDLGDLGTGSSDNNNDNTGAGLLDF